MPQLRELYRYMFPLLTDDEGQPDVRGTAFVVAVGRCRFIVTAAHVVESGGLSTLRFGRGIIANPTAVNVVTTGLPASGNRDDDRLDLAVWQADEQIASALRAQGVLPIEMESFSVEDLAVDGDHYVFSGYPASRTRTNRSTRMIDPGPISVSCMAIVDDRLPALGLNHATHIVGAFDRRRMADQQGQQITAPEPWGMSGGPVWKIKGNDCRLVGVGIEYREGSKGLVASRLGAVVALLRASYPETRSLLPEPVHFTTR